jgi:methylated-DNA-protein-cysteine methyltransferase-like protein
VTPFQEAVLRIVRLTPVGHVVSYGQVAAYTGAPRAARQVGWAMHSLGGTSDFPWWRVLNNSGRITIKGDFIHSAQIQKELLEQENVFVSEAYTLDMRQYRFHPDEATLHSLSLDPVYIQTVLTKFNIV